MEFKCPASQTMGRWVNTSREKLQKWSLEFFRLLHLGGGRGGGQLYEDIFYQILPVPAPGAIEWLLDH